MTKQNKNLIALGCLVVATLISWRYNRIPPTPTAASKALAAAKTTQQDNPLQARFKKIRMEMDVLYRYRGKPTDFDVSVDPFRIPAGMDVSENARSASPAAPQAKVNAAPQEGPAIPEVGDALLSHAIAVMRLGGIVTMNGISEITIEGQLHRKGDVFTTKVQSKLVLIRIKDLTTESVTLALDDPDVGFAESKVRLK